MQEIDMYIVMAAIVLLVIGLVLDKIRAHILFLGTALILMILDILPPKEFLNSFSNISIATIFILILITAGLNKSFNLLKFFDKLFTQKKRPKLFLFQMGTIVALLSSVMNNTPIVAILIPYIMRWSKKMNISPSKFLIPLSYSAITGGMITIIGTSTNLVLNGFLESNNEPVFNFFDFMIPGLLVSFAGVLFTSLFGFHLLTQRKDPYDNVKDNLKEYLVEVSLSPSSQQAGKTIHQAGLRNLNGVYLVEILRGEDILSPVSPDEKIQQHDRLFFAGDTESVVDIVKEDSGFQFPKTSQYNLEGQLEIVEVLIPYNSNLSGKTLKESNFREKFDAAVIAVHRNAERLRGKLGDIKLSHGDLLMLTIGKNFRKNILNNSSLYVLETKTQLRKPTQWKTIILTLSILTSIALLIIGQFSFFIASLTILATLFSLKLINQNDLIKNLNIDLLAILGSSIAIGHAFIDTGGAKFIANNALTPLINNSSITVIIAIYILTVLLTTFITNTAAISIVFPIVFELSNQLHLLPAEALYLTIAFGASCSFISPFGYQTNLMVYGPGGYKLEDFMKIGVIMTLIYSFVCLGYIFIYYNI